MVLTTAIEKDIEYTLLGTITERFADGTYTGESKKIRIGNLEVFHQSYTNVETSLSDWRLFSDKEFNGMIGLFYFRNKQITFDYLNNVIAFSDQPLRTDFDEKYIVIPMLTPPTSQADLIYFEGKVNGLDATIYLDTGYSKSFIDPNFVQNQNSTILTLSNVDIELKNLNIREIDRGITFDKPFGLIIGSDILQNYVFTIDLINRQIIIHL